MVNGELLKLSEQQLVDCSKKEGNEGCNGGLETYAFKYAESSSIELETDYAYKGKTGHKCKATKSEGKVELSTYHKVKKNKVAPLKAAVAVQPTCVSVDADDDHFMFYNKGILDTKHCGTDLDHAVTAVGYGSEGSKEYLIVRNSWGADWGEQGYIKFHRKYDKSPGMCGITRKASYPVV